MKKEKEENMTDEKIYLKHKKEALLKLVDAYNNRVPKDKNFIVNSDDFNIEETFCTPSLCGTCGACCETFPCVFAPTDFLNLKDLEYMRGILNTGILCITKSQNGTIMLRPRGQGDVSIVSLLSEIDYNYAGNNRCILRSPTGCILPPEYRPSQGLLHYPLEGYFHKIMYSDCDIERDYKEFEDILTVLYQEYAGKRQNLKQEASEAEVKKFIKSLVNENKKLLF